ncbi:MAG TPA: tetratricopeptide repeat protein [Terriglobales bacterium]|nr:tetratricopeptide repeat protein [Terriglobales bacterium]
MWAKKIFALAALIAVICGALVLLRAYQRRSESKRLANRASQTRTRAEQGDVKAEKQLASMYYYGTGVPQEFAEAVQWYQKAADQGDAEAEYYLGFMYQEGKGVSLDETKAALWVRKAADQGNARAQAALGYIYYRGKGVPQDYTEAVRWYRKAADQNDPYSESTLGYLYHTGQGVQQDNYEAVRWYRRAAAHGNVEAQRFIASRDARRAGQSNWRYLYLSALFLAGSEFTFDFLLRGKSIRNRTQMILTISGITTLAYVGLSLYGITHHEMRYSVCFNAFWWAKRLLAGTSVVMLVVILLTPRKQSINAEG